MGFLKTQIGPRHHVGMFTLSHSAGVLFGPISFKSCALASQGMIMISGCLEARKLSHCHFLLGSCHRIYFFQRAKASCGCFHVILKTLPADAKALPAVGTMAPNNRDHVHASFFPRQDQAHITHIGLARRVPVPR